MQLKDKVVKERCKEERMEGDGAGRWMEVKLL